MANLLKRWVRYPLEAVALSVLFTLLRLMPIDLASHFGGWLGRVVGPRLRGHRRAQINLSMAMPELASGEREHLLTAMWTNLGRTFAEYPHLRAIARPDSGRITICGAEHVEPLLRGGQAGILISAHLANWEILGTYSNYIGLPLTTIARPVNNPLVNSLIERCRGDHGHARLAKNAGSAREMLAALRAGGVVGMLADQKFNRGIDLPLFGLPAATTDAPAQLSLRTGCPILPVQVKRDGPARFTLVCHGPLAIADKNLPRSEISRALMAEYHALLEAWIRERPAEWLWIHRRWGKEHYGGNAERSG